MGQNKTMDIEAHSDVQKDCPCGVVNIAYEHENSNKLTQTVIDLAPVHQPGRQEQRRSDLDARDEHQAAPLHLDFDDTGKRRSRYYAISDTNELTSPPEVRSLETSLGYHSNGSGSHQSLSSGGRSKLSGVPQSSVSTDRSSVVSNASVLRQTSSFSLHLSPPISPYQNWAVSGESCDTPEPAVSSSGITIYKSIANNTEVNHDDDCVPRDNPRIFKKKVAPQLSRTRSVIDKAVKHAGIPRDSQIRRIVRQLSGRQDDFRAYGVTDDRVPYVVGTVKRPKSYFDLAIMTMCCCVSPLGFVAVILSVLSDMNYKAKHYDKAKKYGKVSMTLSILGIIATLITAITVLLLFAYPWENIVDL